MNVGLDMRLVNTNTLEVADVISYQKQIIGRQVSAGVFDFLGTNFFDVSVGESALEPIQLAVRSVIERATLEMITRIYRAPGGACAIPLGTSDDPLRDAGERLLSARWPMPASAALCAAALCALCRSRPTTPRLPIRRATATPAAARPYRGYTTASPA